MTREEFVKKYAAAEVDRIMRAFFMKDADKASNLGGRWLGMQIAEIDAWIGDLHDKLTEMKNAQVEKQPQGKPSETRPAGGAAKAAPSR